MKFKCTRSTNSWASNPLRAKSMSHLRPYGKSRKGIESKNLYRISMSRCILLTPSCLR